MPALTLLSPTPHRSRRGAVGVLYAILAVLFIALSLTYPATAANAGPNDPDMSQSFSPNAPGEGQYSTLTYTLTNDTGNTKTDLSFTNTLPNGLTVYETRTNSDCPFGATGSLDAVQGNNYITWSGRMGASLTSCTVTVKVIAAQPDTYNNNTAAFAVTNLNAPSNAQLKVSPNWGTCPTAAYLFQNTDADPSDPSDVIRVNLVTGKSDSYDQTAPYMNAVGFNELDNYIWGWNHTTNTLARVNGDFTVTNFPTSSLQGNQNLIHTDGYLLGDVNQNGILMLAATPDRHNQFVRIDLTTSPPTIVDGGTRDTNPYFMADWAQVGGSGPYWGIGRPTSTAPSYRLYSTDNDGVTTNYGIVSGLLAGENGSFGAVYAVDDYLYLSNNNSGNIYRIDTDGPSLNAEFIATGPEANGNDGARCASAVLDIDWADTPTSYNTRLGADGPRSEISPDLIMGEDISAEDNGQPGPAASIDTYDDGVRLVGGIFGANPLSVVQGGAMTVEVQVTNNTLQQARLAGWIDRNNDGAFANNERVVMTIPASSGQAIYTLALPALDGSVTGTTYARFRLIPYDEEPVRPDGPVAIGEVEDYAVAIADPPAPTLTVQKTLPSGRVNAGDQFTLSAVGGAVNSSVTTSGSATGVQGAVVGPVDVATGTSYTVSESASATTNLSQYSSSYSCVDTSNSAAVASGVGTSVTFTMPSGTNVPNVVCTFTNTPGSASVTLQKNVVARALSGDVFGLAISGGSVSASASASTPATGIQNQTATATLVPGTTYTFTESAQGTTVLANYTTTYSCAAATAPGTPVVSGTGTSFTYTPTPAQALTCTFTNTPIEPRLTLRKNVVERALVGDQFTLSITGGSVSGATATTTGTSTGVQAAVVQSVQVASGTSYQLSETASGTTDLADYSSTYVCVDAANFNAVVLPQATGVTFSITPAYGQDIVCTFTNTPIEPELSQLTVVKDVAGRVLAGDQFTLTATGSGLSAPSNTATTSGTTIGEQANRVGPLTVSPNVDYTITETAAGTTDLAFYDASWECVDANDGDAVVGSGDGTTGSFTMPEGADVTCTFTNDPIYPEVSLSKTSQTAVAERGGAIDFEVVYSNTGSVHANGYAVSDPIPAGLTGVTWSCVAAGGAVCPNPTGTGAILETIATFPAGGSVTYSIDATVAEDAPAEIENVVSVNIPVCLVDGVPADPCETTVIVPVAPELTVVKVLDGRVTATDQFTLTATGGALSGASVTTTGTATGTQPDVLGPLVVVAGTTYTVSESAAGTTDLGSYESTWSCVEASDDTVIASGTGTSGDVEIPTSAATAADIICTFTNELIIYPEVSLSKTSQTAVAERGGLIDFEVVYSNTGSVHANGYAVSDPIPAGLTNLTWSCVAAGGAVCPNLTGTGAILETIATFPAGGSVTYSIDATVAEDAPAEIVNVVSVNIPECLVDGEPADPCETTVTVPVAPELTVVKVLDGRVTATDQFTLTATGGALSGASVTTTGTATGTQPDVLGPLVVVAGTTYTVSESAAGTTDLDSYESTWSCVEASDDTVIASGTGTSGDVEIPTSAATAADVICTFTNELITPQISLDKSTTTTDAVPGGTAAYTITVTNTGEVAASGFTISDPIPAGITAFSWTCVATGGAVCPTASGTGAISAAIATFPAGSSLVYSITATISSTPPPTITNVGSITDPPECLVNGVPADPCEEIVILDVLPRLTLQKDVVSRSFDSDQFTLTASGGALSGPSTTATTTGTSTGLQSAVVGPLKVENNTEYFIAEAGAGVTDMDFYDTTWSCVNESDSNAVVASGTGQSGAVTIPTSLVWSADIVCVFTNTAIQPEIELDKSAPSVTLLPGGTVNYTLTVTNTGSVHANGIVVSDPIPTGLTAFSWTCDATGGAVCPTASGTGAINQSIATFPAGGSIEYSITATVSDAPPRTITNTGGITFPPTLPPDPICLVNGVPADPCEDDVTNPASPLLTVEKDVLGRVLAGDQFTLTASGGALAGPPTTATTTGAATGTQAQVVGPLAVDTSTEYGIAEAASGTTDLDFYDTAWECVDTANGDAIVASGTGITGTVTIPTAGSLAPQVVCAFTNDPIYPSIGLTKTTTSTSVDANGTIDYTVTLTNSGAVHANGTTIEDPIPAGLTAFSWTCNATGGAVCPAASGTGAIDATVATFPAGGSLVYSIEATVSSSPPSVITNTATAIPPTGATCTPGNTEPPCVATVTVSPTPVISITKSSDVDYVLPSGEVVYTVLVTNAGSVAANGTVVADARPAGIDSMTWTCAASGGAVCPNASGTGAISETVATFPVGSSLTYTVTAQVSDEPPAEIENVATATPPTGGCAPSNSEPPCIAIVVDPSVPVVAITKSADVEKAVPGDTIVYTVTASNVGPVPASGSVVADAVPAGLTDVAWTCAATAGAVCPNASGTGAISETIATFPAGSTVVYTVTATVVEVPPASIRNVATLTPPPIGLCAPGNTEPPCVAIVVTPVPPTVSIDKTANREMVAAGETIVYTVIAANTGTSSANGAIVSDPIAAGLVSYTWSCVATGGAACAHASGTGALLETIPVFPAGSTVTFRIEAVAGTAMIPLITNVVTITPPPGGSCTADGSANPCDDDVTVFGTLLAATGSVVTSPITPIVLVALGGVLLLIAARRRRARA